MKLILVDDHKIIREGIRVLLQDVQDIEVVGEASNGKELLEILKGTAADVVLLDVSMPEMDGFETLQNLHEKYKEIKVIILSIADSELFIKKMIHAGASGYILKNSGKDELINALKTVHAGDIYLSAEITLKLLTKVNSTAPSGEMVKERMSEISKRELEVLELIAEGYTNGQIAEKLFTSKRTIESHRRNLIEKTKTKNTAELIRYALTKGILSMNQSAV